MKTLTREDRCRLCGWSTNTGVGGGGKPATYARLRADFGLTILTHGAPKLFGLAHGSMADPLGGLTTCS